MIHREIQVLRDSVTPSNPNLSDTEVFLEWHQSTFYDNCVVTDTVASLPLKCEMTKYSQNCAIAPRN